MDTGPGSEPNKTAAQITSKATAVGLSAKVFARKLGSEMARLPAEIASGSWLNATTVSFFLFGAVLVILAATEWMHPSLSHLARDVGFAFWVAIVVYVLFELRSRREFEQTLQREFRSQSEEINEIVRLQDERLNEKVTLMATNVFAGVYQRTLPRSLVDEASIVALEQELIKEGIILRYSFKNREFKTAEGNTTPFVCLQAYLTFTTKNISRSKVVDVPIGVSMPNPMIEAMIATTGVQQCRWRLDRDRVWQTLPPEKLTALNETIHEDMRDPNNVMVRAFAPSVQLRPGESVSIELSYTMAKEWEDTEVLTVATPADGLKVMISDPTQTRIIRARAIHRLPVYESLGGADTMDKSYAIAEYLLPHQGLILWWKTRPPQGEQKIDHLG